MFASTGVVSKKKKKNSNNSFDLIKYTRDDNVELVKKALRDIDVNTVLADGKTIIHFAAISTGTEVLKYLLKQQEVNVNACDEDGNTALHLASRMNRIDTVALLLKEPSCIPNLRNHESVIPLEYSTSNEMTSLIDLYSVADQETSCLIPDRRSNRHLKNPELIFQVQQPSIDITTSQNHRLKTNLSIKNDSTSKNKKSSTCSLL